MKKIQIEEDKSESKSNLQRIEESEPEEIHEFTYELDNESQKSLPTDTEMLAEYNLSNDEIENIKNKLNNS
jgi:hypothetical protein